jgi:uncharacterized membrane protein YbhN (UPF0104 family)
MRRTRSLARWLIQTFAILLVGGFLALAVHHALDQLRLSPEVLTWQKIRWELLCAGWVLSMAALFPAGIAWMRTLKDFQLDVSFDHGVYAYFLGHLGKYVPGKAMAVLLRVGYLHRMGIPVRPTILSVFIETLTSLASGSILGAMLLQTMHVPPWLKGCALGCVPLAVAVIVPAPFRWLIARISRSRLGAMPEHVADAIDGRLMARCAAWSTVGWLLHGTAAWLLLMAIYPAPELATFMAWAACVASMSLAALAGFVSMIPGGAGVRELVATWGVATLVPLPVALASAVVTRLAVIAAELTVVGVWAFRIRAWRPFEKESEITSDSSAQDRGN